MATHSQQSRPARLALRPTFDHEAPDGAWWPASRSLTDELDDLFAHWPAERGHIRRVLYSPPDWDDHPRTVDVTGRRVKTGSFPSDDTHLITLTMSTGERRAITVIPPATPPRDAARLLAGILGHELGERDGAESPDVTQWDNEGGHR